ncbi:MAG TPA: ankyrin repeat domain-containing protein [Chitinophagaceae bacterium]|jgi:peptide-methionine (S)-S-oxide reductase|nr:ankyrin repeat domain-containing protein [Chitinophagaceae bacterium]
MTIGENFDNLFQQAVSAIDAGNEETLKQLLDTHPELATNRLYSPGEWVTTVIGDALKSFFKDPYLLWFVSEDAVRNGKLPKNIATIASIIIQKAKSAKEVNLQEQLDYALRLIAWSTVARDCGVQIELLDVLINSGANINSVSNDALVNGNVDAAKHLVERGGKLTLPTALCLEKWEEADALAVNATRDEKQFSLVLAALIGKAAAVSKTISYGVDINKPSDDLFSHGTPLHHAVWSGSLDTVKVLVNAGANLDAIDTAWNGTPLGWAEYGNRKEIAGYLKEIGTNKRATGN